MGAARNVYLALCLTARTVIGRKATKYGDRSLQSRQALYSTCNVILRRLRITMVAVEKQ